MRPLVALALLLIGIAPEVFGAPSNPPPPQRPGVPPPLPKDYKVERLESFGASLPVPAGWQFWREERSGAEAYFAAPARPPRGQPFKTGLTITLARNISKQTGKRPSEWAILAILEYAKQGKEVFPPKVGDHFGIPAAVARIVQVQNPMDAPRVFHVIVIGDDARDRAFLIFLEAPEGDFEAVWKKAVLMLQNFRIDSGI